MLHNTVLASAMYLRESAVPPTPCHPSRLLQSPGLSSPSHSKFPLTVCILHLVVHMVPCFSLHSSHPLLPPSSPPVSISLFSVSASSLLPCKQIHQYHLSRFHIFSLIYDIRFSHSDLLRIYREETKTGKGTCYPNVYCNAIYNS